MMLAWLRALLRIPQPGYHFIARAGQTAIVCERCSLASFNPQDVENLYCPNCHAFHGGR